MKDPTEEKRFSFAGYRSRGAVWFLHDGAVLLLGAALEEETTQSGGENGGEEEHGKVIYTANPIIKL